MAESPSPLPAELIRPLQADQAERLDSDILAGHKNGDFTSLALYYRTGGQHAALSGNSDAACFLFTQAYVFALRAGLTEVAEDLWMRLKACDREA